VLPTTENDPVTSAVDSVVVVASVVVVTSAAPSWFSAIPRRPPILTPHNAIRRKENTVTPSKLAEAKNPIAVPGTNLERAQSHKKAVISPLAMTLAAVVAGVVLITLGIVLARQPGPVESTPATSIAEATAGSETVEAMAAEVVVSGAEVAQQDVADATTAELPVVAATTAVASGLGDVSVIAADVVDSVVTVNVTVDIRGPRDLTGSGSGIILDTFGTIVTNAHVVADATSLSVTLADGSTIEAAIVGIDESQDVAVLTVDATGLSPVSVGSTGGLVVGNPVIAVGNPLGLEGGPSVTTGIVSALGRVLEDTSVSLTGVIQTDAAITEGSSGGALLDAEGRLVGMTTAVGVSSVGVEGIGFAIPVETVMSVVAQLTS
jgi:S1-C subfamily serine protease